MKHIVLGTAGHIDHGKTLLTKALTGVDCDRLAEEKARGITIELGFAQLKLGRDRQVSIVDVPGHEKFVKTMMAGASGIDAALLVVAADDGVMPQTREHLDILQLLQVQSGIVVITKCDLADENRISEVRAQIAALTRGTLLEGAPVLAVSAATGQGITELKDAIGRLVDTLQQRSGDRPFRLPVDRVFPVKGFGNVVTGTLTDGTVHLDEQVTLYPSGAKGSVRSIQNHNKAAEESSAGSRTAMSLRLEGKEEPARGCTVAQPGSMLVTSVLTVFMTVTPDSPYRIRNSSQLHFFHETREVVCRLRLLDAEQLTAGQSGYAQLNLSEPVAVRYGDRFLLRFFSPVLTVGGGVILDGTEKRLRRKNAAVLVRLEKLNSTDGSVRLLQRVNDGGDLPAGSESLRLLCGETKEEHERFLAALVESGSIIELQPGRLISADTLQSLEEKAAAVLARFHGEYPLQPGIRQNVFTSQLFSAEAPASVLLDRMTKDGVLKEENGLLSLPDFTPVFTQQHKIMQRKLQHYYREAWFQAPDRKAVDEKFASRGEIYPQVLANMRLNGQLISLTPRYSVHPEACAAALAIFEGLFETRQQVTLAEFKTAAGISRKYAQLFLEYWDRQGICRRVGDARVLLKRSTKESESSKT